MEYRAAALSLVGTPPGADTTAATPGRGKGTRRGSVGPAVRTAKATPAPIYRAHRAAAGRRQAIPGGTSAAVRNEGSTLHGNKHGRRIPGVRHRAPLRAHRRSAAAGRQRFRPGAVTGNPAARQRMAPIRELPVGRLVTVRRGRTPSLAIREL